MPTIEVERIPFPSRVQDEKVVLLFSGGQDSSICLALALEQYAEVYALGFDYGQNHACELAARRSIISSVLGLFPQWQERLKEDRIIPLPELGHLVSTGLTRPEPVLESSAAATARSAQSKGSLPDTFVPGRNLLFLLYAAIWGYRVSAFHLMGGMCETDYSGYPDCRQDTLSSLNDSFEKGFLKPFRILTPLMHLTKAQSWQLAHEKFGSELVELIVEHSHSCYRGERQRRYRWGWGCGQCEACRLRARGYSGYCATLPSDVLRGE